MTLGRRITIGILGISLSTIGLLWYLGGRVASYRVEAKIQAPPERVFVVLTDPDLQVHWIGGLVSSRLTTEGPLRAGSRSVEVLEKGGRRIQTSTLVLRVEAPRNLETEVDSPFWLARSMFELRTSKGTHLQHRMLVQYKGFWMRVLAPVMKATVEKKLKDDLLRLKTLVESRR